MKIALVHDYLVQYGGAERVLESFARVFPEAPIYTLLYDREATHGVFEKYDIRVSSLQRLPQATKYHRLLPWLMPLAIERFDLSRFEVVLSDSSSFAKSVITRPETLHISYVHTPMRYAWDDCHKYTQDFGFPRLIKRAVPLAMNFIRLWDRAAADRVDHYVANSRFVARRIKKYYDKEADIIYPPVDRRRFRPRPDLHSPELAAQNYFLMVGRLIAYKRHDIAIEAFNRLKLPLKIIGRGPELNNLRKMAGETIEFLGRVGDDDLARYYANCRAFVFPQEEDFGIVAVEAMAMGKPLIAFAGGDIVDHLIPGVSGVFFDSQTSEGLIAAVEEFDSLAFDPEQISAYVDRFDKSVFERKIKEYVAEKLQHFRQRRNSLNVSKT